MSTSENDQVRAGLNAFARMQQERDFFAQKCATFERVAERTKLENESLRAQLNKSENERGFYMRFAVELQTHLVDMSEIANRAITKARQGAYRPVGAATNRDDGEPIPQFLTKLEETITDELRIQNAPAPKIS